MPMEAIMEKAQNLRRQLAGATQPDMVEVAPRQYVPKSDGPPPEFSLCTWDEVDGRYVPVPVTDRLVRVTAEVLRMLGIPGCDKTLRRLAGAGFIEMIPAAPHTWLLNLDSWFNHLRRVAESEGEFWDESNGNIREYRKAI